MARIIGKINQPRTVRNKSSFFFNSTFGLKVLPKKRKKKREKKLCNKIKYFHKNQHSMSKKEPKQIVLQLEH